MVDRSHARLLNLAVLLNLLALGLGTWPALGQSEGDLTAQIREDVAKMREGAASAASCESGRELQGRLEFSLSSQLAALDPLTLDEIAELAGSDDECVRSLAADSLRIIAGSNPRSVPALRRALLRAEVPNLGASTGIHEVDIICGTLKSMTDWQFDPFFECIGPRALPVRSINLGLPSGSDDKVKEGLRAFAIADGYEFGHASDSSYKRVLIALSRKNMLVTAIPVGATSMRVSLFATGPARMDQAKIDATFGDLKASMSGIPGVTVEELSYTDPMP
jgi:hypothetical protein